MGSSLIFLTEQAPPRLTISGTSPTATATPTDVSVTSNDYGAGPSTLEVFEPDDPTTPLASVAQGAPCVGAGVQAPQNGAVDSPGAPHSGDRNHRCTAPLSLTIPAEDLPSGSYDLIFKSSDIIGNSVTTTRTVNIDVDGPDVDFKANPVIGADTAVDEFLSEEVDGVVGSAGSDSIVADATASDAASGVRDISLSRLIGGADPLISDSENLSDFDPSETLFGSLTQCTAVTACPLTGSLVKSVGSLPEGLQRVAVTSTDALGNASRQDLGLLVDRTAPPPPTAFSFEYNPLTGAAAANWFSSLDPELADGREGTGWDFDEIRYRTALVGTTNVLNPPFSEWTRSDTSRLPVPVNALQEIQFEYRGVDVAGNRSTATRSPTFIVAQAAETDSSERGDIIAEEAALKIKFKGGRVCNLGARTPASGDWVDSKDTDTQGNSRPYRDVLIDGAGFIDCDTKEARETYKILNADATVCIHAETVSGGYRKAVCDQRRSDIEDGGPNKYDFGLALPCYSGKRRYFVSVRLVQEYATRGGVSREKFHTNYFEFEKTDPLECPAGDAFRFNGRHRLFKVKTRSGVPKQEENRELLRSDKSPGITHIDDTGRQLARALASRKRPRPTPDRPSPSMGTDFAAHHMVPAGFRGRVSTATGNLVDLRADLVQALAYICRINANTPANGLWLLGTTLKPQSDRWRELREPFFRRRAWHPAVHPTKAFTELAEWIRPFVELKGGDTLGRGATGLPECKKQKVVNVLKNRLTKKLLASNYPYKRGADPDPPDPSDD